MKRKIIEKLLVIIMITTILAADFFVLGSGLITYAIQANNEIEGYPNIYFSTYFKEGENETKEITESIKNKNLKLYTKIGVNNDVDYLEDIQIKLGNNFNIISSNKGTREGNIVKLDYIGAGNSVEIELEIEPILSDKISADMILKTNIELNAKYKHADAPEGENIKATSEAIVKYEPDEETVAELTTDIITNKIFAVSGNNKRIVQLLIKSRLMNNEYPIKQTKLDISIPNLNETAPEVNVMAIGKLATSGTTQLNNVTTENGKVEITLNNEIDSNNQISWSKNVYDEIVVTYIYPETVDASKLEITTNSEITLHNLSNKYTAKFTKGIENQELNNVIIGRTEITSTDIYKGQLYENIDTLYDTTSKLIVTNKDIIEEIVLKDGPDSFETNESELKANTKYITTEINKEKMLQILGNDGYIKIKNGKKEILINKENKTNENGDIVINHEESATELYITTSNPVKTGELEIKHKKAITKNNYTREILQTIKTLKSKNSTIGTITVNEEKQKVIESSAETRTQLKETISKAELTVNREKLSTTETNEVSLGIKLITDGTQYDLYKNPTITIQLPSSVEKVELKGKPNKLYADEFEVSSTYNELNKTLEIKLVGQQKSYPTSLATQLYLQVDLNITLSKLANIKTDKITMTYKNENASKYFGETTEVGIVEQPIEISAPNQLIKSFDLNLHKDKSLNETIKQQITSDIFGKTVSLDVDLVNNTDSNMRNIRILGKLPTTENTIIEQNTNTLETMLKSIDAANSTIYYTQNINATSNIEDSANGWTTDLTNAKLYLIKKENLNKGDKYTAKLNIQTPSLLKEDLESYTQYEVIYDTETNKNIKESSRKIGLVTYLVSDLNLDLTAKVGQQTIKNGDKVKEGEVIRYTATVTNTSKVETFENIELKLGIPEGTAYVTPIQKYTFYQGTENEYVIEEGAYVYVPDAYYEEITDTTRLNELTSKTISKLGPGEKFEIQYEVRVNTNNKAGTEISNESAIMFNGSKVGNAGIKNIIEESDVRVTIKRAIDESIQTLAGGTTRYMIYIENLSQSPINDLKMQILSDAYHVDKIENDEIALYGEEISEIINVNPINANDSTYFLVYGSIDKNVTELNTSIIVNDLNNNIYKSNALREVLPRAGAIISLTSPQNGGYIKEGDIVEYNINVKNIGEIEENITIEDKISDFLQIQSIAINGNIIKQIQDETNKETYTKSIFNNISQMLTLKNGESSQIQIIAKATYIPKLYQGKVITNSATVKVFGILEDSSSIITHILKASSMPDEDVENIINGYVWIDENGNGQKDGNEKNLSDITVKLYNPVTKKYLKDDNGNILQKNTDSKGEYTFTKIEDGTYLIVFDFDMTKFKHTVSFAEGVDTSLNSKAGLKQLTIKDDETTVSAIEINDLKENTFNMNLGVIVGEEDLPEEDKPSTPEKPTDPEEPVEPEKPTDSEDQKDPENPTDSEKPNEQEKPEEPKDPTESEKPEDVETPTNPSKPETQKTISGLTWVDTNRNGRKDSDEIILSGVKVKIYNISTNKYLVDGNGNILEVMTDDNGKYIINNIEKGKYIIIFEYDKEKYEPTIYLADGVDTSLNSKAVLKKINIDGQEVSAAVTDSIDLKDDVTNINIGLKEKLKFDLELQKYITKIVVQNSKGTKTYNYDYKTFAKTEIHRKQIQGSLVVLEYTIKVKNTGEISGFAKNIVDYLPTGLTFSSELNKDWYLSGDYLYTKSLENIELKPNEEKEIKLILTKTMTNDNLGLINNRAEIYQDYNKYGDSDIDSTPNNQVQGEDDFGTVDIIIQVSTGGTTSAYMILLMINIMLIGIAVRLMIKNHIIRIPTKKGRR